ncbi:unnamed protein product [Rotaria magnacalcarata]
MKYLHDEVSDHIIHRLLKCSDIVLVFILQPIEDIHNDNELLYKTFKIIDFRLSSRASSSTTPANLISTLTISVCRENYVHNHQLAIQCD